MKRRLCLFVRTPELGQVKTRLAATLGAARALAVYERLVVRQLVRLQPEAAVQRELWWTGKPESTIATWARRWQATTCEQSTGSLGDRMLDCLQRPPPGPGSLPCCTLLVGADVIGLTGAQLRQAWQWLAATPRGWVFAPTEDGGYGLLGCHRPAAEPPLALEATPLASIAWGTSSVMAQTRDRCRSLGLRWLELPQLWDVDTQADWHRYLNEVDA